MQFTRGRLAGKVAIITGGDHGFGPGLVEKFVEEGAQVLLIGDDVRRGQLVARYQSRGMASYCYADVMQEEDWNIAVERTRELYGRLDIVVNDSGTVHKPRASDEVSATTLTSLSNGNLAPLLHCIKACVPAFSDNRHTHQDACGGVILNISSLCASRPRPGLVWYAASKSAVSTATKGLAAEYACKGVRINALLPLACRATDADPEWARNSPAIASELFAGHGIAENHLCDDGTDDEDALLSPRLAHEMLSPPPVSLQSGCRRDTPFINGNRSARLTVSNRRRWSPSLDSIPVQEDMAVRRPYASISPRLPHNGDRYSHTQARAGEYARDIPLGRWSTPRDVANAAAFLCSDEAEFITGVCLKVDGGKSLG